MHKNNLVSAKAVASINENSIEQNKAAMICSKKNFFFILINVFIFIEKNLNIF